MGFPYLGKLPYWGGVGGRLEFTLGGPRGDIRGFCGEGLEGLFGVCKSSGLLVQVPDHKEKEKSEIQDFQNIRLGVLIVACSHVP